ncbi:MAG: 4Fe-4S binding protein [Nitrospirae bacterium]|nr:4Fe-4S binding protein [Nitrospirota bacterium]
MLGVFTGRFFCGWFCPEGALFELFDFLTMKIFGRRSIFTKKPGEPLLNLRKSPAGHHRERRCVRSIF